MIFLVPDYSWCVICKHSLPTDVSGMEDHYYVAMLSELNRAAHGVTRWLQDQVTSLQVGK